MNNHPLAWWGGSALLAFTVLHTDSGWVAVSSMVLCTALVISNRSSNSWFRSFEYAAKLAVVIFLVRMTIGVMIGVPMPGRVLFRLPEISLPWWLVGIRVGGDVTSQRLFSTFHESLVLISLIFIFSTANSLVSPHRLLNTFPRAIYNVATSLVIATSAVPQLVASVLRIQTAKRLRGQRHRGVRAWRSIALPLFEESLERAIDLSAAMEARGYGQTRNITRYRQITWQISDSLLLACAAIPLVVLW